jgi:hypothetical protein
MATTKTQIENLISEISNGGNYTAAELRALQNALLENVFGPFYDNANRNPTSSQNQGLGYKQNSLGVNRNNGRYFVCSQSTASTATWEQISIDKEFFSINASNNQTYTIPNSASTVLYGSSQSGVTVNLPTAANSYPGKKVKIFFTSPATNTGTGVTFSVPENTPYSPNGLTANLYTSNSIIEFVFNGTAWVICQFVPTAQDIGYQVVSVIEGGTVALQQDTAIARLQRAQGAIPTSYSVFNVLMPPNPYVGKVVKIMTAGTSSITNITTLTIKTSSGGTITDSSGTIAQNQAIEYVYNGTAWIRVAPTVSLWMS